MHVLACFPLPASYEREEQLREDLEEERGITHRLETQLLEAEQAALSLRFNRESDKLEMKKLQRHIEALQAGGHVASGTAGVSTHHLTGRETKQHSKSKHRKDKTPARHEDTESKYISVIERLRRVVQQQQHQLKQLQQQPKTSLRARKRAFAQPRPKSAGPARTVTQAKPDAHSNTKNMLLHIQTLKKEKAEAEEEATQEQHKLKQQQARLRRELRDQKKVTRTARDAAAKLVDELSLVRAELERSEKGKLQREVVLQLRDETKALRRENNELTEEVHCICVHLVRV